ncbi:FAD/NAD(P)-binding domain-containing protein [Penicillium robsamsonii]|uniref:FAD/NAD(P)-binding domain-containing protein n=1 Tax=Penicillium robsamsonii TaxID=1792511 RepID=UPI0025499CB3|nr:FAD/NAD(P)-binding domain-containing protein [Penicillium robsamsonii]KAJ5834675.1 FAD/NAD(P)-binding domain-containing protein [Penicillium robsamsonii]
MSIPETCTVLVIGGGPAGSYTASVLAREGIDTVLLEADSFPRYHIGESLLPSVKYFLEFIDAYEKFDNHGFLHKNGATFKFNSRKPGFTDFLAAGGAGNHAWNVIRSEADQILFTHAGESGAKVFDKTKVTAVDFEPQHKGLENVTEGSTNGLRRPVSASWSQKESGASGTIRFKYLVDASGRAGVVSTKYMKNRQYNQGLKSIATWGYWESAAVHGPGEGDPFFEAVDDGSGWAWYIPLHDGTVSVGITMKQDRVAAKKKASGATGTRDFYHHILSKETPGIAKLLENACEISDNLKTASDWSYSATEYASSHLRVAGDAGCFIDPLFSSGVHLAMNSGLSAAITICASIRGDCSEETAVSWHSNKVAEGYTRFLLVVTSSLEQIYGREQNILNDIDEPGFDNAFDHFKPVIQGTVEVGGRLTKEEVARSVDFCTKVIAKVEEGGCLSTLALEEDNRGSELGAAAPAGASRTDDRVNAAIMKIVRIHRVLDLKNFSADVINGMAPSMDRGHLGLVTATS